MIRRLIAVTALTLAPALFAQTYIVPEGDCGDVTLHVMTNLGADSVARAYLFEPMQRAAVKPVAGSHSLDLKAP